MGDEEENDDIVGKEYPGGRVGLNCRVIKEPDQVVVEEINHGFINDGYDDYLYEDNGDYPLELSINLREDSPCREKAHSTRRRPSPGTVKLREGLVTLQLYYLWNIYMLSLKVERYLLLSLSSREMEDFKVVSKEI